MSTRFILQSTLSAIANAIRGKTGKTDKINPADFSASIEGIKTPQHYIRGKWMLNATLASKETHVEQTINFTCNGSTCTKFLYYDEGTPTIELSVSDGTYLYPYNNAWASEDFRTFDFGDEYQECSAAFYELFFSNGEDIAEIGGASGQPIEVASEAEANEILSASTADDIGTIYKFTHENSALYIMVDSGIPVITLYGRNAVTYCKYSVDNGETWNTFSLTKGGTMRVVSAKIMFDVPDGNYQLSIYRDRTYLTEAVPGILSDNLSFIEDATLSLSLGSHSGGME